MAAKLAWLLPLMAVCLFSQTPEPASGLKPSANLDPDDPLNDLSNRMDGIATQLESGKSGAPVQLNQADVIDQLDAMIAALKKKSGS